MRFFAACEGAGVKVHQPSTWYAPKYGQVPGISGSSKGITGMALQRMDNVLIVVDNLEAVKGFFLAIGMELEGEMSVEGRSVDLLVVMQQ